MSMNIRRYIAVAALIAASASMTARTVSDSLVVNDRLLDNTFIQAGAGLQGSYSPGLGLGFNGKGSFVADFNVGKWFSPTFGARIGIQGFDFNDWENAHDLLPGANAEPGVFEGDEMFNVRIEYSYLHADVLWDMTSAIGGYNARRAVSFIPYAHMGYKWLFNSFTEPRTPLKGDFAGGLGAIASVRVHNNLSLYADLRSAFGVRHTMDNFSGDSQMSVSFYGIAGIAYDLDKGWNRVGPGNGRGYLVNKAFDNVFVGAWGGFSAFNLSGLERSWNAMPKAIYGGYVGKWFSPAVGARLGYDHTVLSYFSNMEKISTWRNIRIEDAEFRGEQGRSYSFGFNDIHGDVLWNAINTFAGYDQDRVYSLVPYASFGLGLSHAEAKGIDFRRDFLMGAGLLNNFRVWDGLSVDLDLRAYRYGARPYGNTNTGAGWISSAALGLSYEFNSEPWREVHKNVSADAISNARKASGPVATGGFFRNAFVSMSSGINMAFNEDGRAASPAMEIAAGDWVSPYFGFRAGLALMNENFTAEGSKHVYPHVDMMPNVISMITRSSKPHAFNAVPYVGMGYLAKELGWDAGLLASVQVGDYGQAGLDLRATGSDNHMFATGMLGLTYFFGRPDWAAGLPIAQLGENDRSENVKKVRGYILNKGIFDNTFISYSAGITGLDFDGAVGAVDFSAGKWFTPSVGVRVGYQGRKMTRAGADLYPKFNANFEHLDIMWNPLATFAGSVEGRVFDPAIYLQQGVVGFRTPAGNNLGHEYAVGAGIQGAFHVAERLSIIVDAKTAAVRDSYSSSEDHGYAFMSSAMAGLQYDFGWYGWKHADTWIDVNASGEDKPRYWALSTNLLGYADLLTLNLEFQYAVGRHWSLDMAGKSNGLVLKKNTEGQIMDRKSVASIGAKYWPWYVFSGWWFSGFMRTENFSQSNLTKTMGFRSGDSYGAGVSAGYALILTKWFNLDFSLGAWGGYRTTATYEFPDLQNGTGKTSKAFIDIADICVSAMFVF